MSLSGFQRALSDMVASPQFARRLRSDAEAALVPYALSPRERRRLIDVAAQPGVDTSTAIYRLNRITPICLYLPLTTTLLGDDLVRLADDFWGAQGTDLQFQPEVNRFAAFLFRAKESGRLVAPFLDDVLRFELAASELRFRFLPESGGQRVASALVAVHPLVRLTRFRHDPLALLEPLSSGRIPQHVPTGEFYVLVDGRGGRIQVLPMVPKLGRRLGQILDGAPTDAMHADDEALMAAGVLRSTPAPEPDRHPGALSRLPLLAEQR